MTAADLEAKLPDIIEMMRVYQGVEPMKEPVPIQPTAHYAMGGLPTDNDGRVRANAGDGLVTGLFAAGECACVSVHGANRLGTNSLVDLVVFGRRGGKAMADFCRQASLADSARQRGGRGGGRTGAHPHQHRQGKGRPPARRDAEHHDG